MKTILALFTVLVMPGSVVQASEMKSISQEIRVEIRNVQAALAESKRVHRNLKEICFRLGSLYQTTRHELEEAQQRGGVLQASQELATALLKDSKSLPSFCGDKELVENEPGYEQVAKGDIDALKAELGNMDRRAQEAGALE